MKRFVADLRRRPSLEWGVRALLATVAGILGYAAMVQSLAVAVAERNVDWAYQLAPNNARIMAELSRKRLTVDATAAERVEAERLARLAVRGDPTAVPAVTTLGVVAQLGGDIDTARRLFAYSERLTRRDLPTQLWMIEDAAVRENIPEALRHYDIALRIKQAAPDLLFPVLAAASSDPAIAAELVKMLAAQPTWAESFLLFVASKGQDPEATARLFGELDRAHVPIPRAAQASLIGGLIAGSHFDATWSYYASVRPGADRRRSRDPEFTAMLDRPSLLDWIPAGSDTGLSVTIQRGDSGGLLDFTAPPTIGGQLLQQIQLLPPGHYVLEGHSIGIDQPVSSRPYWTLTCRADGRELGRVAVPNSAENEGRFAGRFVVPSGCPAQHLTLVARGSDTLTGLTGQIDRAQLRPVE